MWDQSRTKPWSQEQADEPQWKWSLSVSRHMISPVRSPIQVLASLLVDRPRPQSHPYTVSPFIKMNNIAFDHGLIPIPRPFFIRSTYLKQDPYNDRRLHPDLYIIGRKTSIYSRTSSSEIYRGFIAGHQVKATDVKRT